jgi:hypothetical protein
VFVTSEFIASVVKVLDDIDIHKIVEVVTIVSVTVATDHFVALDEAINGH